MNRILLAEDEERIASFIEKGLRVNGFRSETVTDGHSAVEFARSGEFDLMVLDIGLPGLDGFSVMRRIRSERIELPIIILTARDGVDDTVAGLFAQNSLMTRAPSVPGLPVGRRTSNSRRLANRLGAWKLDSIAAQSGSRWLPSASNTSRSLMPCARAAARTASAASSTRSGSGPAIR